MEENELSSIIESLIFVSPKPLTLGQLEETLGVGSQAVLSVLEKITASYENAARGLRLVHVAEGYQFRTPRENASWIQKLQHIRPVRLSPANLEVLAIVAYKQPVTRPEIDAIRGVDSSHILKTLMERGLIQMDGKTDDPGRPILYSTTEEFLQMFSLKNIRDLPTLRDLEELSAFGEGENVTNLPEAVKEMLHEHEQRQLAASGETRETPEGDLQMGDAVPPPSREPHL